MTTQHFIYLVILLTTILLPLQSYSSGEKKSAEIQQEKQLPQDNREAGPSSTNLIPYVPPKPLRPTPKIRTSQGGTRGCGELPTVTLLTPEHVALTTQEQPRLYWHISAATRKPMTFTLSSDDAVQPLIEFRLPESINPGVHSIYLTDHNVRLQTGKTYEWSVRMLCEQGKTGSGDLVVKSFIKRVPENNQLRSAESSDDPMVRTKGYAANGIWYDAMATLHRAWIENPDSAQLKSAWDSMLKQVGLPQP